MNTNPPADHGLATTIDELLAGWTLQRRAQGGWWALAGFSLQSLQYLINFFERFQDRDAHGSELAKMELLSDIFVPGDHCYTLVQVKRTLDRGQLRSALREAYEIFTLCDEVLQVRLRLQIVCLKRLTPGEPKSFSLEEVLERPGDERVWRRVLEAFDSEYPIVEQPDPLDQLYNLMWNLGVRDPSRFVDGCLGLLLRLFHEPSKERIEALAQSLRQAFVEAQLVTPEEERIGRLVRASDVAIAPEATTDRRVLFDRRPQLRDLQLGRVRVRPKSLFGKKLSRKNLL